LEGDCLSPPEGEAAQGVHPLDPPSFLCVLFSTLQAIIIFREYGGFNHHICPSLFTSVSPIKTEESRFIHHIPVKICSFTGGDLLQQNRKL
jgi:hypothetical protein